MPRNDISPSGPLLLTFTETAREMGVSVSTVRHLIATGKLTVVELDTGRTMAPSRRIRRSDLLAYVESMAVAP